MPTKSPKKPEDRDHLKLKYRDFEAVAFGRYPLTGVFVLVLLAMIGRGIGLW